MPEISNDELHARMRDFYLGFNRVIVWFSCGEASAIAARLTVQKYPLRTEIVYCDTLATEHPDNARFLRDVSQWCDKAITVIRSTEYRDIDDVFDRTRYMAGIKGARCTTEMKKVPRNEFQRADDLHVFGFTADKSERNRLAAFRQNNPELRILDLLGDQHVYKSHCAIILRAAGIKRPAMYALGFDHNNCLGCVKATSPGYWVKVARNFPDVFKRRCEQSRELGVRLVRVRGERIFLDELDLTAKYRGDDGDIECGPYCATR